MNEWFSVKVVPGRIGGPNVGSARKLKPAVFDADSVDMDLDGMHQEGTTAQWYGLGRNNPIFKAVEAAFKGSKDHDVTDAVRERNVQLAEVRNAPPVEASTLELDTSFISGVVEDLVDGDPKKVDGAVGKAAAQFLAVREERRAKLKGGKPSVSKPEKVEKGGSLSDKIKGLIEERKKRRLAKQAELNEKARKLVTDRDRKLARGFRDQMDGTHPPDTYEKLWHDVREVYERKVPPPDLKDYENHPSVKQWERENPYPEREDHDSARGFSYAADEWNDDRTAAMFDAAAPDRDKWEQDFQKEVDQTWAEMGGAEPGSTDDPYTILRKVFTFDFEGPDGKTYSAVVDRAENIFGRPSIVGNIFNEEGDAIGLYERSFNANGGDVYHDHLVFHADSDRKLGLAGIFNARNEEIYREMGYTVVATSGHSSYNSGYAGATHWPKAGFDWADDAQRDKMLTVVKRAVSEYDKMIADNPNQIPMIETEVKKTQRQSPIFTSKDQRDQIEALIKKAESQAMSTVDRLTASDFVDWPGAELFFQRGSTHIDYVKPL